MLLAKTAEWSYFVFISVVNTDEALDSTCNPLRIIGMIFSHISEDVKSKFCLK